MITIKNEFLTAKFSTMGAELKSLVSGDREYIWQGDPVWWENSAPVLFPICGRLMDDEYILDGKTYHMDFHGFAHTSEFEVESLKDNKVTFLLKSNEETLKCYPFDFEFRVIYSLDERRMSVRFEVTNKGKDTMYFSIGCHEGYSVPEGVEEYEVAFPQKETLFSYNLDGSYLDITKQLILDNDNVIKLKKEYFEVDTLVFKDIKSRSAILRKRDGSVAVRVEFDGFSGFMLWQEIGAPFICMEPWNGLPDRTYTDKNFKTKEGIEEVAPNSTYIRTHSIEILK